MAELRFKAVYSDEVTQREKDNQQVAYEAACESITLLENDGTLPLAPCQIALYGGGAAHTVKGGTGSGEVNERHAIGIAEGLAHAGYPFKTQNWLDDWAKAFEDGKKEHAKNSKTNSIPIGMSSEDMINIMANPYRMPAGRLITDEDVANSDAKVCIYAISRQAGECADRELAKDDFTFMEGEIANLKIAVEKYEKVILVINVGGTMDMSVLEQVPGINAVIFFCQQGMEGGRALADVISGKVNPSGGVTDTWVRNYSDVPFGDSFGDMDGNPRETDYKEGIYVGYRYYDSFGVPVRYPFGYGLSYTSFDLSYAGTKAEGNMAQLQVKVTNTGSVAGKRFVQVYASAPAGTMEKENKRLVGYAKSGLLAPGEEELLTVDFDLHALSSYSEAKAAYVLEAGNYVLSYGINVANTVNASVLYLPQEVVLEKCEHICPLDKEFEELHREAPYVADVAGLEVITLDVAAIETTTFDYNKNNDETNEQVENWMKQLTPEQKLTLLAGSGMFGGEPYFYVPGSAAYTAAFPELGLSSTALCDGPAGLRLQRVSAVTKKGKIKAMEMMMDFMNDWPKFMKKIMCGDAQKDTLIYQNATAFPVGTALAMTWNQELIERVGDAAGREMEEFGCTFWLAPGMNIHRNPLCGRNYEYYSEDPVVSGKTAAAISRGVQSHAGCYVTIKHYAANNQETCRAGMSSNMKERALREIYLEGFRIAVREGHAKAVMTSYNKLNHVYTPNSYDLCTKALRNEWGFNGVVMTDWMSTDKGLGGRSAAYKAGNDLIMPGGNAVVKECTKDFKAGRLSQDEIDVCCRRVLKAVSDSKVQKEYFQ